MTVCEKECQSCGVSVFFDWPKATEEIERKLEATETMRAAMENVLGELGRILDVKPGDVPGLFGRVHRLVVLEDQVRTWGTR